MQKFLVPFYACLLLFFASSCSDKLEKGYYSGTTPDGLTIVVKLGDKSNAEAGLKNGPWSECYYSIKGDKINIFGFFQNHPDKYMGIPYMDFHIYSFEGPGDILNKKSFKIGYKVDDGETIYCTFSKKEGSGGKKPDLTKL